MSGANLSEKLAVLATLLSAEGAGALASGCSGNHHVSPWGGRPGPAIEMFLRPPDLDAQLALIDAETSGLRLTKTDEIPFDLPPDRKGGKCIVRGYVGRDATGQRVHAVRVATPLGVVLAEGPLDASDVDRSTATELLPEVPIAEPGGGGAVIVFPQGRDMNGDGSPDIVLKSDAGALAMWRISSLGSGAYQVKMEAAPTRMVRFGDLEHTGFWGLVATESVDPIAPRLTDVATFDGKGYSDVTPVAREWHASEARSVSAGANDAGRLRGALERAWHLVLSGKPRDATLTELSREKIPRELAPSFDAHRRRLAVLVPR